MLRWTGCARSFTRDDILAFFADSLTLNASGLNCTWSIDCRTIGCDKLFIRSDACTFTADLGTFHSTSLSGRYSSGNCLGFDSSCNRVLATAFSAGLLTAHTGCRISPSALSFGLANISVRELAWPWKAAGVTGH